MSATFDVTYEIVTEESARHGGVDDNGYICQNETLREAIRSLFHTRTNEVSGIECVECDESPIRDPRWITVTNGMEYRTGAQESRLLHMPDHVTVSSRRRIASLCGVRT